MEQLSARVIILYIFWLYFTTHAYAQCTNNDGCFCFSGFVTCSGLKSFPSQFPLDTTMITISNMDTAEIPANVLNTLPLLNIVEIHDSKINRISSAAFSGLSNMERISLNEVEIGTVERGAFFNLTNIGVLSIYYSTVDKFESRAISEVFAMDEILLFELNINIIEPFAFSNIDDVYKFNFNSNNVTSMQPNALFNVKNTYQFSMMHNSFGTLGCHNVESLVEDAHDTSFYSNSVQCTCALSWVIDNKLIHDQLFLNWCTIPNTTQNIYWNFLTRDNLACLGGETGECHTAPLIELDTSSEVKLEPERTLPRLETTLNHHVEANLIPHIEDNLTSHKIETSTDGIVINNETGKRHRGEPEGGKRRVSLTDNHTELKNTNTELKNINSEIRSSSMRTSKPTSVTLKSSKTKSKDSKIRTVPSAPVQKVHIKATDDKPVNDSPVSRDLYIDTKEVTDKTTESKTARTNTSVKDSDGHRQNHRHGGGYVHVPAEKMAYEDGANGVDSIRCGFLAAIGIVVVFLLA